MSEFWFSVKRHKPASSGTVLVFQETTGYVLDADCEHFKDGSFKFVNYSGNDHEYLTGITHFANIPPIPLECVE